MFAASISVGGAIMDADYPNPKLGISTRASLKYFFKDPHFNVDVGIGVLELENFKVRNKMLISDFNLEYNVLPYDKFTPFIYGGLGMIFKKTDEIYGKFQYGVGFEYLPVNNIGIKVFGEQNLTTTEGLDGLIHGKRDDYFWRFGVGVNVYLGKPKKKLKSVIFE